MIAPVPFLGFFPGESVSSVQSAETPPPGACWTLSCTKPIPWRPFFFGFVCFAVLSSIGHSKEPWDVPSSDLSQAP